MSHIRDRPRVTEGGKTKVMEDRRSKVINLGLYIVIKESNSGFWIWIFSTNKFKREFEDEVIV